MKLGRWLEAGALYLVIAGALCAGLAAAYGRERESMRDPDRRWWVNRLLILPVLGITSAAAAEALALSLAMAAFATAMLTMGGYEALRWIETGIRQRADKIIGSLEQRAVAARRPAHRPTMPVEQVNDPDPRTRPVQTLRDVIPLAPASVEDEVLLSRLPAISGPDLGLGRRNDREI